MDNLPDYNQSRGSVFLRKFFVQKVILLAIIGIAILFRFNNLNWDNNQHLHPDERFLTMVGNAMVVPQSFDEYIDPKVSKLNPSNLNYKYFVYGVFPLVLNKYISIFFKSDDYNNYVIQGRILSSIFDIITVFLVYCISVLLIKLQKTDNQRKNNKFLDFVPYLATLFYAISVLPIQLSHFFAVDTFLTTFMLGSFYLALKVYLILLVNNTKTRIILCIRVLSRITLGAMLLGFGLACKINAIFILPINIFIIWVGQIWFFKKNTYLNKRIIAIILIFSTFFYLLIGYLTLRLVDPYKFTSTNIFDLQLNPDYINSINTLREFYKGNEVWFPPAIQFMSKTRFIFSFINHFVYGLSIPLSFCFLIGTLILIRNFFLKKEIWKWKLIIILMISWSVSIFLYQASLFLAVMRYFIYLYPFFAIIAAYGLVYFLQYIYIKNKSIFPYITVVILIILSLWPIMFSSIYKNKHSRIQASEWIYKNLPANSILLYEHWDDPLPLPLESSEGISYIHKELPVFEQDTEDKWIKMTKLLNESDYYILSSNRGWGSIMPLPWKYPLMSHFYEDLFKGETNYVKIKEISSYPSIEILGIKFETPDEIADEAFSVYDHPKVLIFKNIKK